VQFIKDSKMLLFIALPLLFSRIMDMIVFFIGFILIAKLGSIEFAASSLASSVYITTIVVAMGILYAMGIKMSQAFGEKDHHKIRGYFHSSILLAILLTFAGIGIIISISYLLPFLGQKAELVPSAKKFMQIFCMPMFPTLFTIVINQVVTVLLKPRIVFFTSIINTIVTICCFYPLMFGGLGIPSFGAWGFGLALVIGNLTLAVITIMYIATVKYFKEFELFNFEGFRKELFEQMMSIIRLGLPMGIQFGAEIAAFAVTTFLIGTFGSSSLIAAQVAQQVIVLALVIPFTLSEATSILIGQSVGKKDKIAIRSYGFSSQTLTFLILAVISVIFIMFPRILTGIYVDLNNPNMTNIISLSIAFLYIAAIGQLFDGVRNVISGALRALNDSIYPMYTGIFIMWCIGLPIGTLLAFYEKLGPIGFPIGAIAGFFMGSIILFIRFYNKTKDDNALFAIESTS
jgi:multidrug resistance protein, MATE family